MKLLPLAVSLAIACAVASSQATAQTVIAVRPSCASLPENLLRLSIVFAERPTQPVIPSLQLLRDDGTIVDNPFDQQELWSPDDLTLTVLLQPGRVKTGLVAHDTLGRALVAGEHIRLTLKGQQIARWNVTASNTTPLAPSRWMINPPRAGTRAPLSVMLGKPIDAMGRDMVAIAGPDGRRVPGKVTLSRGETRWSMVPSKPWIPGDYAIVINAELEDSSGNRVGESFEHSTTSTAELPADTSVPFRIRRAIQ
ncbi:hypothetical protein A6V36_21065 [Paraburkholderia ginsengiterrae]|uniref:SbsA Ig-like domain-containing protein n=1 Tax=Paraburkholderia ginsengiterrae TaxID=1462993 RepID=A0A1A9NA05_9BURK|nr:hypothetical protein [Paraburkholderia ginsengiterrae]OAJ62443.1 hypothetical protein A6V36_21065 [Paraburkholderia ginsengiterrae]OAJ62570.1 hypothetical protein A6V37_22355 [Paraburkholderia ginsengiterrae]